MTLERIRGERLAKAEELRAAGLDPYPHDFRRSHSLAEALDGFADLSAGDDEVRLVGRIVGRRVHGKTAFADVADADAQLQVWLRPDDVGSDHYQRFVDLVDLGDIVGFTGTLMTTRTGQQTLAVTGYRVLAKALRPPPDAFYGLSNVELRYRQRYVDLIANPEVRDIFRTRSRIIQIVREVLDEIGGLEVETPTLQPIYGGAAARPFETHHHALDTRLYLRIADELYLKRLIVGGFDCVYEICKDFRNEGMDREHNPEFTMVEVYWAYRDYHDMMDLTERIFSRIAEEVKGSLRFTYQGMELDLATPWARRPMLDLIAEHAGVAAATASEDELRAAIRKATGDDEADLDGLDRGRLILELFEATVEEHLVQPTFVTDWPKETSPLAKTHRADPALTERFELFIARREMANAFSELNDPVDQRARFETQARYAAEGDEEAHPMDDDFVRALEYGMPPTGGLGIGIDRMVMLFTDQRSIQEVILFPQMRPEVD